MGEWLAVDESEVLGRSVASRGGFRHEALQYANEDEFLAGTLSFIREGLAGGESVVVAVSERKIELLSESLREHADRITFVDMAELGRNPARIIPAWREFAAQGSTLRGIGEPAWPGRTDAELCECDHHESLLNLAFADAEDFRLLCPYDATGLPVAVLDAARRNHPVVSRDGERQTSGTYVAPDLAPGPFSGCLAAPASEPEELEFGVDGLSTVRRFVWARAHAAELSPGRQADLVTAVNELTGNSIRHGGGGGLVRIWREEGALFVEVSNPGSLHDPLVGRERPDPLQLRGRGSGSSTSSATCSDPLRRRARRGSSADVAQLALRNLTTSRAQRSGCSSKTKWPAPAITTSLESGISRSNRFAAATGAN